MSNSSALSRHGVADVNFRRSSRIKKNGVRVQYMHDGLTQRPTILKEGYLHKPSFFRFGGRKRRWCVLRTYSAAEASMDIFVDETKTRYKGTIILDLEVQPVVLVKTPEANKRRSLQSSYIVLKVGKSTYHFTTESYKELKQWSALFRQVIGYGSLFAANIVEPTTLESGMVNVQFASNYIALLCPVREVSIKRWRLDHVTSFGQCGGTLTFECCVRCSDPLYNRCSLNIMHEKPAAILSLMEKVIRENPNTGEIHYERSILGDIYHCTHLCGGSPRMLPAYSDSNLFRIADSPMSIRRNGLESSMPPELHRSDFDMAEFHSNTLESNDSGLPGTPLLDESPRGSSILSSPTSSTGNSGSLSKSRESPPAADPRPRTQSDLSRYCRHPTRESVTPGRETEYSEGLNDTKKVTYSTVMHQPPQRQSSAMSGPSGGVTYTVLKQDSRMAMTPTPQTYNKLYPVVEDNAPLPPERKESRYRSSSTSPPNIMSPLPSPAILQKHQVNSFERRSDVRAPPPPPKLLHSSKEVSMPAGYHHSVAPLQSGDVRFEPLKDPFSDPDETDYDSPPQRGRVATQFTVRELPASMQRPRAQSQGEILYDSPRPSPVRSFRGTFGSTSREVDEVADSYKQNALEGSFSPFFRLDELEYDETDTEGAMEIVSNLADYRRSTDSQHHHSYCKPAVIDKVLSKVACDNVRGYAYKITIPMAGPTVVYDVPRRAAPLADPKSYNRNPEAPPKPLRNLSKSTELLDSLSA